MEKNNMTAVEWLVRKVNMSRALDSIPAELVIKAKQMEEEQKYETSAFWFGRGILAGKENRIEELKPTKE